jgi:hypothetical protein
MAQRNTRTKAIASSNVWLVCFGGWLAGLNVWMVWHLINPDNALEMISILFLPSISPIK